MNKYKINLIYKEDGSNIYDLIINTLINELKVICKKEYSDVSLCTCLSLEEGENYLYREENHEL